MFQFQDEIFQKIYVVKGLEPTESFHELEGVLYNTYL
jgi:hypothetical protein